MVIHPLRPQRGTTLMEALRALRDVDDDFVAALEADREFVAADAEARHAVIYLLDTNILIYLIKNQPPAIAQRIDALPAVQRLCMSFITWAELLKGAERSRRKAEVLRRLETLHGRCRCSTPPARRSGSHYAEQATRLKAAGTPIGANDLWIACHALAEDATLVTHTARSNVSPGCGWRIGSCDGRLICVGDGVAVSSASFRGASPIVV